jgi:hypothetical protein
MSLARLKRLQRLESRQPAAAPWRDPGPAAIALLEWFLANAEAVRAGKACRLPYEPEPESQWSPAKAEAMRYHDRTAARLAQEAAQEARP